MENAETIRQAGANLVKAESELERAQALEHDALQHLEHAAEELGHSGDRRGHEDLVRIHINRKPYESLNPTTRAALYELGHIPHHEELFREVGGDAEDQPVLRDAAVIHLKQDDHFYSEKVVTIVVNGEKFEETKPRISFEAVVKLAYPNPPAGTLIEFTVTYRKGPAVNPRGTLTAGHSVRIKNEMVFDVTPTDRS